MASSSNPSFWQKTKTGGKAGFDKLWAGLDKLGAPVNRLSNKLGAEAFWPTTLDKESDKAARILRSFCKDGFYQEELKQTEDGPKQKQRVLVKIPTEIIQRAKGLAIFTTMRTGLWFSGAGGSGVVVARTKDGWSPPTGIMLHTAGLGFLVGVDIYDCVLVLMTQEAVDAFTKVRCTVGGEISAVAGPVGAGGLLETEVHRNQAPIFTYLKSRGFYVGVQIDGTLVIERTDENERFYGSKYSAAQILRGEARPPSSLSHGLSATLRAAQGDRDVDESAIPNEPPPAAYEVEQPGHVFGIPDKEDPDPYGVEALSKEGYEVKDATTHSPVADSEFEFRPRQQSIAYAIRNRTTSGSQSPRMEAFGKENHKRYASSDHSTQTDPDASGVTKSPDSFTAPAPPIQMHDNEEDTDLSAQAAEQTKDTSAPRDSYEDVSLNDTPQKPSRGPPPALPPRSSAGAAATEQPAVTTGVSEEATPASIPAASDFIGSDTSPQKPAE